MSSLLNNLAKPYSKTDEYGIYDMCIHANELFQCVAPTSGAWNPKAWKKTYLADLFKSLKKIYTDTFVFVSAAQTYNSTVVCKVINSNSDIVATADNVMTFQTSGKLHLYGTMYLHTANTSSAVFGYDVYKNGTLVQFVSNISEGATVFAGSGALSYVPYELEVEKGDKVYIQSRSTIGAGNPTFVVGYMVPEEINGAGSSNVFYLGTGTTFDIKTLMPKIDYTKLTVDNFICCYSDVGSAGWTNPDAHPDSNGLYAGLLGMSHSVSYIDGVLTITGHKNTLSAIVWDVWDGGASGKRSNCSGGVSDIKVYLVLDKVKSNLSDIEWQKDTIFSKSGNIAYQQTINTNLPITQSSDYITSGDLLKIRIPKTRTYTVLFQARKNVYVNVSLTIQKNGENLWTYSAPSVSVETPQWLSESKTFDFDEGDVIGVVYYAYNRDSTTQVQAGQVTIS